MSVGAKQSPSNGRSRQSTTALTLATEVHKLSSDTLLMLPLILLILLIRLRGIKINLAASQRYRR